MKTNYNLKEMLDGMPHINAAIGCINEGVKAHTANVLNNRYNAVLQDNHWICPALVDTTQVVFNVYL